MPPRCLRPVVCVILMLLPALAAAQPVVTIDVPAAGARVNTEQLSITARVTANYDVSVTATVESRQATLAFDGQTGKWQGTLSLAGLAREKKVLTVRALDATGAAGSATRTFTYDLAPTLHVTAPVETAVARPTIRLAATCTDDDDPDGCSILRAYRLYTVGRTTYRDLLAEAPAGQPLDAVVSLARFDNGSGGDVTVEFLAQDSGGNALLEYRHVRVLLNDKVRRIVSVGGRIVDVSSSHVLFLDQSVSPQLLKIHDRGTGVDTTVPLAGLPFQHGYLTPFGAIVVAGSVVHEWRNGELHQLTGADSVDSLRTRGDYAIWNGPNSVLQSTLFRRDLRAGTTIEIAVNAGNISNDVAANGDVAYWTTQYRVRRDRDGVVTDVPGNPPLWDTYPLTDGTNILFRRHDPCCTAQRYSLMLLTASLDLIELAPLGLFPPVTDPRGAYAVENGWAAFLKYAPSGASQVWERSPAGDLRQISSFAASSTIEQLAPNGELIFNSEGQRYLSRAGVAPERLIAAEARWLDDRWHFILGNTLFELRPESAACAYAIDRTRVLAPESGGAATISLSTTADCPWTATSNVPWLGVAGLGAGDDSATVTISIGANPGGIREGTVTIAGRTVTVQQEACFAACPDRIVVGVGSGGGGVFGSWSNAATGFVRQSIHELPWRDYNLFNGELHPAVGDIDGDGLDEVVVGFGAGGDGWMAVFDDAQHDFALLTWLRLPWSAYNAANGTIWPAVGDIDGDGRAEIVAGLGAGGQGWYAVFDDAVQGHALMAWRQVQWASYNLSQSGETHPAIANVDGGANAEIVIGLGAGGAGWFELVDDAAAAFAHIRWMRVGWTGYWAGPGETYPAAGDVDNDGLDEIVVGLGRDSQGWVEVFDDAFAGLEHKDWLKVGWTEYANAVGETHPAVGDVDGLPGMEIVLGLGRYARQGGWFEIRGGAGHAYESIAWRNVDRSDVSTAGAATFPAVVRLR